MQPPSFQFLELGIYYTKLYTFAKFPPHCQINGEKSGRNVGDHFEMSGRHLKKMVATGNWQPLKSSPYIIK